MKDLKFTPMTDSSVRELAGNSPDAFEAWLHVEWKGNKAQIRLRPHLDDRTGIVNGPMDAFFPNGSDNKWFEMRNEKIHRHAHQYLLDICDVLIVCPDKGHYDGDDYNCADLCADEGEECDVNAVCVN